MHWAWMNGTGFLAVGFLLYLVVPRLQGARKALLLLVTVSAFLGSYGITSWPAFLSLNWKMSSALQALVDLCSLGLCLLVVRGIAEVVAKRQPVGEAETARAPSPARVREPSGATPVTA
jgi:hypothetical protein